MMLDELGDVLFQVHFLALLLEERGEGDMAAVAEHCREKLIRRHPHVFGDAEAATAGQVLQNWDRIKRETEGRSEPFADVPENLPALLYARKVQRRAGSGGGTAEQGPDAALARLREALVALSEAAADGAGAVPTADPERRDGIERAVGELLFCAVELARGLRVDPELALRATTDRFKLAAS